MVFDVDLSAFPSVVQCDDDQAWRGRQIDWFDSMAFMLEHWIISDPEKRARAKWILTRDRSYLRACRDLIPIHVTIIRSFSPLDRERSDLQTSQMLYQSNVLGPN